MKNRILVSVLGGLFVMISACGDQEPTSAPTELGPSLLTAPVPFTFVTTATSFVSPTDPCVTVTPGEVIFKDCQVSFTSAGDFVGTGIVTFDLTWEGLALSQQNGSSKGQTSISGCVVAPGVCGDFEGTSKAEFVAGLRSGTFRTQGITGDVEGIRIRGTSTETTPTSNVFNNTGEIRFPKTKKTKKEKA